MNIFKHTKLIMAAVSLSVVLVLSGCGGGGGGGTTGGTKIPTAAVKITATNAESVASSALSSAEGMTKTSELAGVVGVMVQSSGSSSSVLDISLAKFAQIRGMKLDSATGVVGAVAGSTIRLNCANGEETTAITNIVTMTFTDKNGNGEPDAGDTVTMSFKNCNNGDTTENGSMSITITSFDTSGNLNAAFKVTFNKFSSKDNATNETVTIHGDTTLTMTDNGTTMAVVMTGTSLTMTSSVDGAFRMTNYNIIFSEATNGSYSISANMTLASKLVGGSVIIVTTTPFTGSGDGNPTAGVMVITGAGNSTMTITARSNGNNVGIVVDEDGAGPITPVNVYATGGIEYTWDEL